LKGNTAEDGGDRQRQQPAYVARVSVRQTGIETEQGFRPIEAGMAVTAEIKAGQRRLIAYLLSPILRYQHDSGRER
jgi:hemolysin D